MTEVDHLNSTLQVIQNRKSVREYTDLPIDPRTKDLIIQCAMRAPTAGNLMLYSIIDIQDQTIKDKLAVICDNQPFIATAPMVLLFVADYQRWFDFFMASDVETYCREQRKTLRYPGEGDLLLACCEALIAAQTAVIAAEALGVGSCYIGDIMENHETIREMFDLPQYTFPAALVCFGYPSQAAMNRKPTSRFPREYICFQDKYRRLEQADFNNMYAHTKMTRNTGNAANYGQLIYARKFSADYSVELTRSVREWIKTWVGNREE
jgi:FMN reductase (NADPH)/FMN reductase [NAD(P)H]